MKILLTAVLMSLSLCATAQATSTAEEATKAPVAKKVEPRKAAQPKKKVVAAKATKPVEPKGKLYVNDPKAPVLLDKTGSAIPTDPKAYDVSSATGNGKK